MGIARSSRKGPVGATGPQLISHHEHNWKRQVPNIVQRVLYGEDVAVVSDAGTPSVSDPGSQLVRACLEQDIQVVPMPGPCSVSAAASVCGFNTSRAFAFHGFLPRTAGARQTKMQDLLVSTAQQAPTYKM